MSACLSEHPYQSGRFGGFDGAPLRPGGTELTCRAVRRAGFLPGQSVLDLGCGEGWGAQVLVEIGCRVIGLDMAPESLVRAAAVSGMSRVAGDATRLPLADASVDGILAECVLSLVEARRVALAECRRVLRPGGRLALSDVFARTPVPDDAATPSCLRGLSSAEEVADDLARAGFIVECWEDHSDALRNFFARMIFESGSPDALWHGRESGLGQALRIRRPGYFLTIARVAEQEN